MTKANAKANPFRPDRPLYDSDGKKTATLRYRTIADMESALTWAGQQERRLNSQKDESNGNSWTGTKTATEYATMLREGWQHGVTGVEGLDGLSTDAHERLTFVRNVGGVFPIVPAYLANSPDAMLDVRPERVDNVRGVTLVVDASFTCNVKAKTALDYARSVMKLIAWLQAERIDASVYVICPINMGSRRIIYTTPIRESGMVFQPERIAAVVHPSWLRRAWFAMVEREYYEYGFTECEVCRGGYGQVRHASADEMRQALPEAYSVIMLPKVGSGDPEKTVRDAISLKLRQE